MAGGHTPHLIFLQIHREEITENRMGHVVGWICCQESLLYIFIHSLAFADIILLIFVILICSNLCNLQACGESSLHTRGECS